MSGVGSGNLTISATEVTTSSAAPPTTELPISTTATTPTQAPEATTSQPTAVTTIISEITTVSSSGTNEGTVTMTLTLTSTPTANAPATQASTTRDPATATASQATASSTSSTVDGGNVNNGSGSGMGSTTRVVVAVVVPIVGVALVAIALIFLWKRRQKNRADKEARRKEVEEYGFNPNNDPHGAVPVGANRSSSNGEDAPYEMIESDGSGYRGWGSTNGGRKTAMSSNLASSVGTSAPLSPIGVAFSDNYPGNPGPDGYAGVATSPTSAGFPATAPSSDGNSNSPLINGTRPGTNDSSIVGAMAGPSTSENTSGIHRGISNASSNYSAMTHSDQSDIGQPLSHHDAQYYGADAGYDDGYYYSGHPSQQYQDNVYGVSPPVIRDVQARRNTRIETPTSTHFPQQGNSGIAQNF